MGGDMLEIVCLLYEKVQKRNRKLFLHNVLLVIVGLEIPSFPKMENLCSTYVSISLKRWGVWVVVGGKSIWRTIWSRVEIYNILKSIIYITQVVLYMSIPI